MIVVLYRWRLKAGQAQGFACAWEQTTRALIPLGALGSALFKADDGTHYAIAKWPDEDTRQRVFAEWDGTGLIAQMQAAVEESYPHTILHEVTNLW